MRLGSEFHGVEDCLLYLSQTPLSPASVVFRNRLPHNFTPIPRSKHVRVLSGLRPDPTPKSRYFNVESSLIVYICLDGEGRLITEP